ncbi:MAG: hypothetical protein F4Z15_02285 [Gammaproteobacteria bacterium]|nr:hypothetical protein [Gammaproteobacteria bacterium]MYD76549.1 hypothetical protein [Gammaproteobacteria bacterium]MYJ51436.1 hypothetical protein [Gammaproteobacteria bacterium]
MSRPRTLFLSAILIVSSQFVFNPPVHARAPDEPECEESDPGLAVGIIVSFSEWPLDPELEKLLIRKVGRNGLKLETRLDRFKTLILRSDEMLCSMKAMVFCLEIMLDERFSSLLEYCEPDFILKPAQEQ